MKRKKLKEKMIKEQNKKWLNPRKYYLNSFLNHESLRYCPECGGEVEYSSEEYSTSPPHSGQYLRDS